MAKKKEQTFLESIEELEDYLIVEEDEEVEPISTGSFSLDIATGIGGVPKARITEIYGPPGAGKTTLALSIAKQCIKDSGRVLYIDIETGLEKKRAESLIKDFTPEEFLILQPRTSNTAFEIAERAVSSGEFGLIIFDSIGALLPQEEEEVSYDENTSYALVARALTRFCKRNAWNIKNNRVAFVFINQVRANIGSYYGGYSHGGGYALQHYASLTIFLGAGSQIKQGSEDPIGIITKFVIKKNKVGVPFRSYEIPIIFDKGVDHVRDVIEVAKLIGVLKQRGSYYYFEEENLGQGLLNTVETLENDENTLDKIKELCYNTVNSQTRKETE